VAAVVWSENSISGIGGDEVRLGWRVTKTIGLKPVGDDPKPQIWGEMFSGMLPTKPQRLQIGIAQTERSPLRSMQRQMDLESSFQWMRSMPPDFVFSD